MALRPRRARGPTRREWVLDRRDRRAWFGVYNVALNEGERRVDAGTAAMLIQVSPVLIALLAASSSASGSRVYLGVGLALAFAGVALIGSRPRPAATATSSASLLCLVSAVVYSSA